MFVLGLLCLQSSDASGSPRSCERLHMLFSHVQDLWGPPGWGALTWGLATDCLAHLPGTSDGSCGPWLGLRGASDKARDEDPDLLRGRPSYLSLLLQLWLPASPRSPPCAPLPFLPSVASDRFCLLFYCRRDGRGPSRKANAQCPQAQTQSFESF